MSKSLRELHYEAQARKKKIWQLITVYLMWIWLMNGMFGFVKASDSQHWIKIYNDSFVEAFSTDRSLDHRLNVAAG